MAYKEINTAVLSAGKTHMRTELRHPYDVCIAVTNGFFPENLSLEIHGKHFHSRLLTMANQILCVYIGKHDPSG